MIRLLAIPFPHGVSVQQRAKPQTLSAKLRGGIPSEPLDRFFGAVRKLHATLTTFIFNNIPGI
jgi:hypothetical protein